MPATTVRTTNERLTKMTKLPDVTDPSALDIRIPPRPAMAADSMKTLSLSLTRFCPRVAAAAGLSFMAVSRRP